jgi:hypothetical protein
MLVPHTPCCRQCGLSTVAAIGLRIGPEKARRVYSTRGALQASTLEKRLLRTVSEVYAFVLSSNKSRKSRIRSSAPTVVQNSEKCLLLNPLPLLSPPPFPCRHCPHAALLSARHAVAHCLHMGGNIYQGLPPPAPPPWDGKRPPPPPLFAKRGACLPVHRIKLKHHVRKRVIHTYAHAHADANAEADADADAEADAHSHAHAHATPKISEFLFKPPSTALVSSHPRAHTHTFECCPPRAFKHNRRASIDPQACGS